MVHKNRSGGDEALILNTDGSISETNTANILLVKNNSIILPESSHVLPGIMCSTVCEIMTAKGFTKKIKKVFPNDLFDADQIILTNSLMGAVPVKSIDGKAVNYTSDLSGELNRKVL